MTSSRSHQSRTFLRPATRPGGAFALGLVGLLGGCADAPARATAAQPVIYGTDDRQDVYAHPDAMLRQLASQSIVAQFAATAINVTNPSSVQTVGMTLGESQDLCAGERFANDPAHSSCSGTLIDDNLLLTAGHCFEGTTPEARRASCRLQRFVFNYYRDSATAMHPLTSADVFQCDDVVVWANGMAGERNLDYAIVRLDRAATPRFTPVAVRRTATAQTVGAPMVVIGFGSGIPAKIDTGGRVSDGRATTLDYFVASTDTFSGNSGSGVFDSTSRELIGILVRGATDYVMRGTCNVANVCTAINPDTAACAGESVNYPHEALAALCAGAGSARLCATMGDAGTVADAGTVDDSGAVVSDAGTVDDSGAVASDADTVDDSGAVASDAGAVDDSGAVASDAGAVDDNGAATDVPAAAAPTGGGGGCAVATPARRGDPGLLASMLALVGALWLRRRSPRSP